MKNSPLCENGLRRYLNGVIVLCGILEEPPICFVFKVFRTPVVVGRIGHRKYYSIPDIFFPIVSFFVLIHQSSWFVSYANLTTLVHTLHTPHLLPRFPACLTPHFADFTEFQTPVNTPRFFEDLLIRGVRVLGKEYR